ncbi:MAG: hypothetical protein DRN71_06020 [Candidatus Nanohalarchaeota archaeon]|nr:MAG: hypothetical protein DRN71_06020 [Candidatus Nanohaloarchaeota archaeon]
MNSTENKTTEPTKVLIVENDPGDAKLVRTILASSTHRHDIDTKETLKTAIEYLNTNAHDIVLLDMGLPDSDGVETISKFNKNCPDTPIIVLTGLDDEETGVSAMHSGAQDYLVKGQIDTNLLTRAIRYAIERKKTEQKLKEKIDELEMFNKLMVGRELKMIEMKKHIMELEEKLKKKTQTNKQKQTIK